MKKKKILIVTLLIFSALYLLSIFVILSNMYKKTDEIISENEEFILNRDFFKLNSNKSELIFLAKKIDPDRATEIYANLEEFSDNDSFVREVMILSTKDEDLETLIAKIQATIIKTRNLQAGSSLLIFLSFLYFLITFISFMIINDIYD